MALINLEEHKLKASPIGNYFSRNAIEERITSIMKTKNITVLSVLVAFILVAVIVTVSATASPVKANSSNNNIATVTEKAPNYPVNEQGQTYGHAPYPVKPSQEPDLIKAEGENGVVEYVKASDLIGPSFSSPEEAIAHQEALLKAGDYESIPLYESDGKTVIVEFRMYLNYSIPN